MIKAFAIFKQTFLDVSSDKSGNKQNLYKSSNKHFLIKTGTDRMFEISSLHFIYNQKTCCCFLKSARVSNPLIQCYLCHKKHTVEHSGQQKLHAQKELYVIPPHFFFVFVFVFVFCYFFFVVVFPSNAVSSSNKCLCLVPNNLHSKHNPYFDNTLFHSKSHSFIHKSYIQN